jgi:hypothetical protein
MPAMDVEGGPADARGELHIAVVCASNMNRSMEAHRRLRDAGLSSSPVRGGGST